MVFFLFLLPNPENHVNLWQYVVLPVKDCIDLT